MSPHMDPRLAAIKRFTRDPKKRLAEVHSLTKTKNECEMDEPKDEAEMTPEERNAARGHGGCGHIQPLIRREGLKLFMVFAKGKDDVRVAMLQSQCSMIDPEILFYRTAT